MSNAGEFWTSVHAALDARRDPIAEAAVQRALAATPQRLEALTMLCGQLQALARRQRTKRRAAIAAAMKAAVLVLGAFVLPFSAATPHRDPAATAPRVLTLRATVVTERPGERSTTTFDGERVVAEREHFAPTTRTLVATEYRRRYQP